MAGPTNLRLLTDFFNKIGHQRKSAEMFAMSVFGLIGPIADIARGQLRANFRGP